MSILIKGMEMPKNCGDCRAFLLCDYGRRFWVLSSEPDEGRPEVCPLVEVPTPHGRLIDASDLSFSMTDSIDQGIAEEVVADAPTIIEAEKGK